MHHEDDEVVEEARRLGVGPAHELPDGLDELLRAEHLGGVQAAVDPDDRLPVLRQLARLRLGDPLGARELLGDRR